MVGVARVRFLRIRVLDSGRRIEVLEWLKAFGS